METRSLAEALENKVGEISALLSLFVQGQGFPADLVALRRVLTDVLDLVERDPGIGALSDDLYEVARDFMAAREDVVAGHHGPGREWVLSEVVARYRERLASAQPSAMARGVGLV